MSLAEREAKLELARRRQELWMRAVVLLVVIVVVFGAIAAVILRGPALVLVPSSTAGLALLAWIVRRLFPREEREPD